MRPPILSWANPWIAILAVPSITVAATFLLPAFFGDLPVPPVEMRANPSPAADLHEYARAYYLAHSDEILGGFPVQRSGVHLKSGGAAGETFSPTPDQLSAMGFAPHNPPAGVVSIMLSPYSPSATSTEQPCQAVVHGISRGLSIGTLEPAHERHCPRLASSNGSPAAAAKP